MNYFYLAEADDPTLGSTGNLIVTILIILVMGYATFLLGKSILKYFKNKQSVDEELSEGVVDKKQLIQAMADFVVKYRRNNEFSLLYIELQNIGNLNEIFGPRQFNRFKQIMLDSLKKKLPRNAMLCQYNTNEYMILLRGRIAEDKLNQFANALLDTIETPLAVGSAEDGTIVINALMGIVIYPLNGTNEKDLFNNAEMALYMSKKEGKSRYTIFNDNLSKTEQTNLAYYREIKEAMRKKEFAFYYHPIINTSNDTISFIEAFIRWNHPVLGVLPPNKFLTIMEHSGDINWVGRWGIEELCKQLLEWKKIYPSMDFRLSFNLSPKQLLDPKICEDFLAICKANRVETSKIVLEIVEFAIFEKYGIVAENIEKFDKLGFTIAIDDFGVEANTLARLSTLPIKIVKLDKKFIETSKENFVITKIVNMLVEIANNEHLEIVAEGVEDYDVMTYIKGFNIFECQGYAFTKPLDAKGMQKYIGQETWKDVTAGRRVIEKPETKPEMPLDEEPKIADAEEKAPEEVKEEVTEETK